MKRKRIFGLVILSILLTSTVHAQRNKSYIQENSNRAELKRLAAKYAEEYRVEHAKAIQKAIEMGWDTVNLDRLDSRGNPIYVKSNNNVAASITNTTLLRTNLNVYGDGMTIGEWDGGHARQTHQDMAGRVTIGDSPYNADSHATHVGGTLIGNPPFFDFSRGMAYNAELHSYDWDNDLAEMATAADEDALLVSNHSYGNISGWNSDGSGGGCFGQNDWRKWTWYGTATEFDNGTEHFNFGLYNWKAEDLDEICWNAPFYLPVFAAGNDHNNNPQNQFLCDDEVRKSSNDSYVEYNSDIHPPGDGYLVSSIGTYKNAKNILTVGNLEDDGTTINESSSRGRTDDGRIKPDICGNGTTLFSADSPSDIAYTTKTGTSMASPNVAGSLLLLQQAYEEKNGNVGLYMRSATLKGLVLHTAVDLGWPGPDYTYGWGRLDAAAAGTVIQQDAANTGGSSVSRMLERNFTTSMTADSYYFNGNADGAVKLTMCYTDLPGTGSSNHNETTPELVHDLDIRLYEVNSGNLVAYPFQHGSEFIIPDFGDNDVDNTEQILWTVNETLYELRVVTEDALTQDQPYSLIISGQNNSCVENITHDDGDINSFIYRASNNITSSGTVPSGRRVSYQGGNSVKLTEGFHAKAGSYFKADMNECN